MAKKPLIRILSGPVSDKIHQGQSEAHGLRCCHLGSYNRGAAEEYWNFDGLDLGYVNYIAEPQSDLSVLLESTILVRGAQGVARLRSLRYGMERHTTI